MINVLEQIMQTGYVQLPDGHLEKLHSSISPQQGKFLQEIILELQPKKSLEVGLAFGVSALYICEALKDIFDASHIIIDPFQLTGWKGVGINNLKNSGFTEIIKFYNEPSYLTLPRLEAQGTKIDFAFIDGMHTFDYTLIDFFYIDRLLNVGGVVAIDDTNIPAIQKVCRYITTNRSYSVFRCLDGFNSELHLEQQLLQFQAFASEIPENILKPEILQPDFELGIAPGTRCIAFKKEAEDTREWNFHKEF